MSEELQASGGAGAPAEVLDYDKVEKPVSAGLTLVDEERELAEALLEVVERYGKFNDDNTGVWAGYTPAAENEDNAKIGVKCGNCVFWQAPNGCQIIQAETEEGGLCRFAILPDGAVTADADGYGGECPPATQDIQLNLENRQNAIDNVGYGPLNPAEPNDIFWQDKAERWNTTVREAKTARCGNCIFFVRTPKMLDCLEQGIGLGNQEAEGSIEAGELGYCNALDFKCASERTCNAWAAGGPVTEETVTATAGSKPAPKKDRIFGSKKNKKGSAATGKGVTFSKKVEESLAEKVKKHNEKAKDGRKTSLRTLKAVYRRGAGAFSTSHRPDQNRNSWAMARVNAFLKLLRSGRPSNPKYTTDNDLLPASHPRSSKSSAEALLAALTYQEELTPMLWESHVPTEEMGRILEKYNSKVGPARQVDFNTLSDVAERAVVAYGYLEEDELYNAIRWDATGFMEFATQGQNESSEFYDRYQDLLPAGHPLVASAAADEAAWVAAGYTDDQDLIDTLVASAIPTDDLSCLYAATRIKAIAEAGNISAEALEAVNAVAQKYTASH